MKICIAQPEYSADYSRSDELFEKQLELFSQCDDSMDIIVFPESCDIPCLAKTKEDAVTSVEKYNKKLLETASAGAAIFIFAAISLILLIFIPLSK